MSRWVRLYRSAIVKKAIMAVTGVVLFGFVLMHMTGNLKAFQGAEKINGYGEWLREVGYPLLPHGFALWGTRIVLLAAVGLHILSAVQLTRMNRRARPTAYGRRQAVQLDYASRTMRWSGFLIAGYVVYHLMHFTIGNAHGDFVRGDVYHNLVTGFQNPLIAGLYVVINILLGIHLYHGLWSMFQSLGLNHPTYNRLRRHFAVVFAVIVTLGFVSVPISVQLGLVA